MRESFRWFRRPRTDASGFTLVELMVTLVVFAVVIAAVTFSMIHMARSKQRTSMNMEGEAAARAALDLIARDLRSAGYDADRSAGSPQPAIAYIDSMEVILVSNQAPWPDTAAYRGAPQAYSPAGSPKPFMLTATSWTPTQKYTTGAELIRYTLDVNNDGAVSAADLAVTQGRDAAVTRNPSDYVLVRQVYGDSTGLVAGDNGGSMERVALVLRPGGQVPPMFRVYMKGSSTPWNWASGAVPAAQLEDIERVEVTITAGSASPDHRGEYARVSLTSDVNSLRNTPDFGIKTFPVSGYVFNDLDSDGTQDAGEPGLSGVQVRLGTYVGYTGASGSYTIRAPNGTYVLKHTPPAGFGVRTTPDSFVVTINNAAVSRSFADTARSGGLVEIYVWDDDDGDGEVDGDESHLPGMVVKQMVSGEQAVTSTSGTASVFAPVGGYSVSVTVPDDRIATTANPVSGTMTNGGSATHKIGLQKSENGEYFGYVFRDNNRNGVRDGGESGIQNVWVGVTTDGGVTIVGYAYTDANGYYEIVVPANDPPQTTRYSVFCVPPGGLFPTTTTSRSADWLSVGEGVNAGDFGMAGYTVITLNASRVLSLAAGDLIEKEWNGNQTHNARGDADLVLGADAGGTDNVSVWFNAYNSTPAFAAAPTYTRNAPQSVLAMALDTLDGNGNKQRRDLVTGTKKATNGNFFVWYNQGTSDNEGYFPATFSTGQNYTTLDLGDVQSVQTIDHAGGAQVDLIVGTKSPTADRGTIEFWQSNDATTPTFSRVETFTTIGSTSALMGEVNGMALHDLDNDGKRDLVVVTKNSPTSGMFMVYRNVSKTTGNRFVYHGGVSIGGDVPVAVACTDVDGDGYADVLLGTRTSATSGRLWYFRNRMTSVPWAFSATKVVNPGGIPMSMHCADMGGGAGIRDLVVGLRSTDTGYSGGVRIYFLDVLGLPDSGVDPSAGSITNMVPAVASADFNYGVKPSLPTPPYLTDLAVGVKISLTTGALVVFIR